MWACWTGYGDTSVLSRDTGSWGFSPLTSTWLTRRRSPKKKKKEPREIGSTMKKVPSSLCSSIETQGLLHLTEINQLLSCFTVNFGQDSETEPYIYCDNWRTFRKQSLLTVLYIAINVIKFKSIKLKAIFLKVLLGL